MKRLLLLKYYPVWETISDSFWYKKIDCQFSKVVLHRIGNNKDLKNW